MDKTKDIYTKITKLATQLHDSAKFSEDWEKCIEVAIINIIGNDIIALHCSQMGITKKDYVKCILAKMRNEF